MFYKRKINIYTVKVTKDGLKCARPCYICVRWMAKYNVDKVIYSDYDENIRIIRFKEIQREPQYLTKTQREGII